ncbi:MAG: 30S ribosomal protein S17 [Candidatus Blackburnbacteria bacterium]|nr:30S ribosomal protein S17 [Candidatus Blackburnbacteria bacterium]
MKALVGKVVGTKQNKTVIIEVERFSVHPLYEKRVKRTKRYPVHSETELKEGDKIRFVETRPISKTKRWRVVEVLK